MSLLLLLQAVPIVAPPAPPAPPPIVTTARMVTGVAEDTQQDRIAVEVRGGGALLWQGDIRVGSNGQSSVRQTQTEPAGRPCRGEQGYRPALETGLTLTLQPVRFGGEDRQMRITVRWVRSGADVCPVTGVTRAVELTATADLAGDQPVTLEGDAGLKIRLRRQQ